MARKIKIASLMRYDTRYRIPFNPVDAILSESVRKSFSTEDEDNKSEIDRIIEETLREPFKLGGHPKYDYLLDEISEESDFELHRVENIKLCSLFIDLENFTKRAMFIDEENHETLSEIANLKQDAISTWIKVARFYEANIHSITGDGLMILIGATDAEADQDEWVVGARALLIGLRVLESAEILNQKLKELLKQKGKEEYFNNSDNRINIKVGIEYSPETLMNPQGVIVKRATERFAVGEVKATSFEVDFSAKVLSLYSEARRKLDNSSVKNNRLILFGEKYKELMEFNEEEVCIGKAGEYKREMYETKNKRDVYYIDCKDLKDEILTLDDVKNICNVEDISEFAKQASIMSLKDKREIQHG